jgi:carbohydrate diacid regulator
MEEDTEEYNSSSDYAEFLVQSLKEELGIDARVGVGSTVKKLKDSSLSYAQGASALRYAEVFGEQGSVHSYREYALVKMLEDASESRLRQYLSELMDEGTKEIMDDEEMVETAEEFLRCSLNVSETSRQLFVHRNTLVYRLEKIYKLTGLDLRKFDQAIVFKVAMMVHKYLVSNPMKI